MATPNLYEDNKGKVTKETGSSGGGLKMYDLIDDGQTESGNDKYIIKDATRNDIFAKMFYLRYVYDGNESIFSCEYKKNIVGEFLVDSDYTQYDIIGETESGFSISEISAD